MRVCVVFYSCVYFFSRVRIVVTTRRVVSQTSARRRRAVPPPQSPTRRTMSSHVVRAPIARAKSVNHTVARVSARRGGVVVARAAKKSTEGDDDEDEPGIDFRGLKQLVSMGLGTLSGDITEINLDDPKRTVVMELGACVARRDVGFD